MSRFTSFFGRSFYKHPILWSFFGILVTLVVIYELTVLFLVYWTHHGETTIVPDVIDMPYAKGEKVLKAKGLEVICNDSVFIKGVPPGTITDVIPAPNSVVKAGREVYVTRVCYMPQTIVIEREVTDYTVREFENMLKHYDIMFVEEKVPSEVDGNLVGANYKRKRLRLGDKVAVGDMVTVLVGKKVEIQDEDDPFGFYDMPLSSSKENATQGQIAPTPAPSETLQQPPTNVVATPVSVEPESKNTDSEDIQLDVIKPEKSSNAGTKNDPLNQYL